MPPGPRSDFARKRSCSTTCRCACSATDRMIVRPRGSITCNRRWTRAGSTPSATSSRRRRCSELRAFLAAEVAAGRGFLPARAARLQRAPADAVRGRPRRHPRPGPLPRPRARRWACASRSRQACRRRRRSATSSPSSRTDLGAAGPDERRPQRLGGARRPAPQRVLTVAPRTPASHAGKGWEHFTDRVDQPSSRARREGIVFLLWGRYAQQKGELVDSVAPPRPHRRAPVSLLGEQRLLRLPALLPGERAARGARARAGRLAARS